MLKALRAVLWRFGWRLRSFRRGGITVGDIFPDFALSDLEGRRHALSEPGPQWTVLWFTNLCEDCLSRLPALEELRLAAGDRFRILAVSLLGPDTDLPRQAAARCGFPILIDPEDLAAKRLGLFHAPNACPFHNLFILDRRGRVLHRHHLSALGADGFRRLWSGLDRPSAA